MNISDYENKILCGDNIDILKSLPDKFIDCCVTSPPYYGLRDYGTGKWIGGDPTCPHRRLSKASDKTITGHAQDELKGNVGDAIYKQVCPLCGAVREDKQVGLEETPEAYIDRLVGIFREVRRVLKDDGTLWVNIGDSYNSNNYNKNEHDNGTGKQGTNKGSFANEISRPKITMCKPKDLMGIPWMLALALRNDGWYLRQDIIWCLSGGTYLYVKSQKGVQPMSINDLVRLNPKTVQLWNGEKWVNVIGWGKSNDTSQKLQIVLRSGERIQCTGGHKWVLEDGTEKLASELCVGDILKTTQFEDEGTHNPFILTPDILWLIGLWVAEGSKSDDCIQIALHAKEITWIDRIRNAVESVGGTITYTVDGNKLAVRIYSQVFFAILHQYIGGKTAKNKHLNNICWQLSNQNLKYLIEGYFDGDGHYEEDNNRIRLGFTRNYNWERDLRLLANRLGATITLKLSVSKIGKKEYPSFRGEWRWEQSKHFNNKNRAEIIEINSGNGKNYYDISVDCDNHLFALASGVITHNCKPNPMPEPVKDRFTKSHEYVFLLSKKSQYFFNQIQETANYDGRKGNLLNLSKKYSDADYLPDNMHNQTMALGNRPRWSTDEEGEYVRNKRDVWTIPTQPVSDAHFATYPEKLVEPCILAGSREGGIVLDPFFGSGTTGRVAVQHGRKFLGIELNPDYVEIAKKRVSNNYTWLV